MERVAERLDMLPDKDANLQPLAAPIGVDETIILPLNVPSFAWLMAVSGSRRGRLYRLKSEGSTVGRASDNTIVIDDETTSRYHARLYVEGGLDKPQFYVLDLASANGVFVNGERVSRQAVQDDDRVTFGEAQFVFKQL